jgi:hypothetical protein
LRVCGLFSICIDRSWFRKMANTPITISIRDCRIIAFQNHDFDQSRLRTFCQFSSSLLLPVHLCDFPLVDATALERLTIQVGIPERNESIRVLLLCGGHLEQEIAFATQYFLVSGYRVSILRDLVNTRDPQHAQVHDLRLVQAGAVLTTQLQVVYEWLANETNEQIRSVLKQFSFA